MAERYVVNTIEFQVGCLRDELGRQQIIIAELDADRNCGRNCLPTGDPVYIKVYSNVDYDRSLNKGSWSTRSNDVVEDITEVVTFNNFIANVSRPIQSNFSIRWIGRSLGSPRYEIGGTELKVGKLTQEEGCTYGAQGDVQDYAITPIPMSGGGYLYRGGISPVAIPEDSVLGGFVVGGASQIFRQDPDNPYPYPNMRPNPGGSGSMSKYGFGIAEVSYKTRYDSHSIICNDPATILALFIHTESSSTQQGGQDFTINETVYTTVQFEVSDECDVGTNKLTRIKVRDFITKEVLGGADVEIDGAYVGTTDDDGMLEVGLLNPGNHTIRVVRTGYAATNEDGLANDNFSI